MIPVNVRKRTAPPGLVCRLATREDYEGVLAINKNVYEGMDYLPGLYHQYIQNPLRVMAVAELNGQIVGFEMIFVVDGGETAVYQAGRIMPDKQRMGLMYFFLPFIREEVHKRFPSIKKGCYTSVNKTEVQKFLATHPEGRLVAVRPRISCDTTAEELRKLTTTTKFTKAYQGYHADSVTRLCILSEAERFLQRPDVLAMSPEKYWITAFEPLGALACNAAVLVQNLKSKVFVSWDKATGNPTALSFGAIQAVAFGVRYRMDFYMHPNFRHQNQELFLGHVLRHLNYAKEMAITTVSFSALHGKEVDNSLARRVIFEELGLQETKVATANMQGYLCEFPDVYQGKSNL